MNPHICPVLGIRIDSSDASAGARSSAAGVCWDLSDLFAGPDDPALDRAVRSLLEDADAFAETCRDTIDCAGGPSAEHLLAALRAFEEISQRLNRLGSYGHLLYAADTSDAAARDLHQRLQQQTTEIHNRLLFFNLEWLRVEDDVAEALIAHDTLVNYRHYLRAERRYKPHTLSEPEEKICNEKANTGSRAFGRLFTELTSAMTFTVERDGEDRTMALPEVLALMHEPDRDLRRRAYDALFGRLADEGKTISFLYDVLVQDHQIDDRLRGHPHPMASRHLVNEIDRETVERMMSVTEANHPIAHEYFALKARLMGLDKIALYDQYAPVGGALPPCTYGDAREIVLEAFAKFDPEFRDLAAEFFDKNWIDAELRPGKRGGAFCAYPSPDLHPYILVNHTDNLRDVMTIAHELGHGLHGQLARAQTLLNYDTPLTTAETASVFAEFLVFDHLMETRDDPAVRLALVCSKIEDAFATVFRQNVLTRYEQMAFARREEGRLSADALCEAWWDANAAYYGDALEMPEGYRWGWSYIPHFIHTRFYCYSYVFGELLVLSLVRMYKEERAAFVPRYRALLTAGGSDSPETLLGHVGVDVRDEAFWQKGFDEIAALVSRAKELAEQVG